MESVFGSYFDAEKDHDEISSKYLTKYFNGKPTKKYIKLLTLISMAKNGLISEIERLMTS